MDIRKVVLKWHMAAFQMTCCCGDTIKVEDTTREQAVSKLKALMNESMVAAHMNLNHLMNQRLLFRKFMQ